MIYHIVLLPFKSSVSEKEALDILKEMGELKGTIPQIQSFSGGKNNSPEGLDRGYQYGFIMTFNNVEDRAIYLEHPAHIALAKEKVLRALEDGVNSPVVFDFSI